MTKIITLSDVQKIVHQVGHKQFNVELTKYLEEDFRNWNNFQKNARIAFYKNQGVMELMPICGEKLFSYKYVNGHPNNTKLNKLTVVGSGLLADVATGEPVMIAEMTLLTALRTGATSALASKYLARKDSTNFGIIGCGSQSEFQVLAHQDIFDFKNIYYFDVDSKAMNKFAKNLSSYGMNLIACSNAKEVVEKSEVVTTCTAYPEKQEIIKAEWLKPGQHINAMGGDSPHKTELEPKVLDHTKIVVEYFEQTSHEGEIQNIKNAKEKVYAELWEVILGDKKGRQNESEITLFDSVGFALEDYSILRYMNDVSEKIGVFHELDMVPELENCKDLFGLVR
ncbi:MAG: ornithine cyclodeaminase [bacterium]